MEEIVYIVEDENNGNMYGFWSREQALRFMVNNYLDCGFGGMKDAIIEELHNENPDMNEIESMLDYMRNDIRDMLEHGYADGFMFMREVAIKG